MISAIDAGVLLRQAMRLTAGDPLPGEVLNPAVSGAYERVQHAAGSVYIATHHLVETPSIDTVAASLGEPLFIPNTLGERALLTAQAVLRGRMLDQGYVEFLFAGRSQGMPINEATVAAAVALVTAALSHKQQQKAA